ERISSLWYDADEVRWAARQWAARIGVPLRSVHIRPMARKWASISTSGRLTLDAHLLDLPRDLGEFVIVHELVHLLSPESAHGRVFQAFMLAYMPDWEDRLGRLDVISQKVALVSGSSPVMKGGIAKYSKMAAITK